MAQRRDSRDSRDKVGTVKNSDNSLKKHYIREHLGAVILRRRWHQKVEEAALRWDGDDCCGGCGCGCSGGGFAIAGISGCKEAAIFHKGAAGKGLDKLMAYRHYH